MSRALTVEEHKARFRSLTTNEQGCWLWPFATNRGGYGLVRVNGKMRMAHRFAYELFIGPIPAGMDLDHLCRVRACVNPEHLEAVSHHENVMRGQGNAAINARKTHCVRGHDLALAYVTPAGYRQCRLCQKLVQP